MSSYKVLKKQIFELKNFEIVPIRFEDRIDIMNWRNEQIFHLRQAKSLTEEDQNNYFEKVVFNLFDQEKPSEILFSFLKDGKCVGYGGLVHINWIDQNAEISFIMETALEKENFNNFWSIYLKLIEEVAFNELELHKLYVYAFDLRPHLYETLMNNDYFFDCRLDDHCLYNGKFIDVVIHSKINK